MKTFFKYLFLMSLLACNSNQDSSSKKNQDSNLEKPTPEESTSTIKAKSTSKVTTAIVENLTNLKALGADNPILSFQQAAEIEANKVMKISKNSIQSVLNLAKEYETCFIVVGDHTIVKLLDIEDCSASKAWGACMPFGEGYVKRGKLNYKKDYINYIVGIPDSQVRKAYFFN